MNRRERIAIEELAKSRAAQDWAKNTLAAYGLDPGSPEYTQKIHELSIRYAKRMLRK